MPYAQDHETPFPADFIAEAVDQTRGWFYTLHVLATALFDKPAFQNVICSGWIVAADGDKLSKKRKNYAPMDEIFDLYGVDSLRFFLASSPLVNGEDARFRTDFLQGVQRKIFMTLNNVFNFYKLYADVDGYKPSEPLVEPHSDNILDQWMLSRLNEASAAVTKAMDGYRLDRATRPIADLLDDASNWYVRRSRRRFWKSEDDGDKQQAYATLHYTLLRLCQLLAPFSPFLPDHLWGQLVQGTDLPPSVHLSDWPQGEKIDKELINEMAKARGFIADGLAQRAEAKIKVRQPLQSVTVPELPAIYEDIIAEELNVKEVKWSKTAPAKLDTKLTPELKAEGLMREIVRHVQKARKDAGLNVDNRIHLSLETADKELQAVLKDDKLTDIIKHETLATTFGDPIKDGYSTTAKIDTAELTIKLSKSQEAS
jgi:isoleucyl-tRNA synthetase